MTQVNTRAKPRKMGNPQQKPGPWDKVKKWTLDGGASARIKELYNKKDPIKVLFYNNLCPGDLLAMTGAIEALHQQYPGRFLTGVASFHPDILLHNPHVTRFEHNDPDVVHLWTTYPLVNRTNQRPIHFMEGYLDWLRTQLDIDLVLDTNRPHIYLSDEEKEKPSIVEELAGVKKYWIVNAGWKNDFTIKRWPTHFFQEVVNYFKDKVAFAQIGLVGKEFHNHPPLENVIDIRGKTSIRELMRTCYHAQGGLGTITCIQHMFAAFQKPYVVTHGGREPIYWTAYQTQKVFSKVGTLPCCEKQGCWRSRVVPLNDGDSKDRRCCELPVKDLDGRDVATCMWNIKPRHVIEAIEEWYAGGVLKF